MHNKIEVASEQRVFDGYIKIDQGTINEINESGEIVDSYPRFKVVRPNAVAVLIFNSDENSVILVKQHRYATHGKVDGDIYEAVAGKIDAGETPEAAAVREIYEEVGYKINPESLSFKNSYFASPGYTNEVIFLFTVTVTNADIVSEGGGVEGEHENIDIQTIKVGKFFEMFTNGEIVDMKTALLVNAFYMERNQQKIELGLKYYNAIQRIDAEDNQ